MMFCFSVSHRIVKREFPAKCIVDLIGPVCLFVCLWLCGSDGRNKKRFDSIAIWIATKIRFKHCAIRFKYHMQFDTDSIQILTIRFKRHAIWTEIWKSWLELNTHSHYSLLSQILSSNVCLYHHWCMPAIIRSLLLSGRGFEREINARKSAAPKNGNSNGFTIRRSGLCLKTNNQ